PIHLSRAEAPREPGHTHPADVKVGMDALHAYVTEGNGDLVRISWANANRAAATVLATGMTAPQQIFLDEAHGTAYVVEHASPGHLWRIHLASNSKTPVVSDLEFGVGLVLSADLQYAYVSEQTAGPDQGRVSRIQISNGVRTKLAVGLTKPSHLAWADAAQTSLLVTELDPANRVTVINLTG